MTEKQNEPADPVPAQTAAEARAAAREADEQARFAVYESIPQKHWMALSGRQAKVLREQSILHGIPFGGAIVKLSEVARALHDHFAKLAKERQKAPPSDSLEHLRAEKLAIAKLSRQQREGELVPRELAHKTFGEIASILRSAGETLERDHGVEALRTLESALSDAARVLDRNFANHETTTSSVSSSAEQRVSVVPGPGEGGKAPKRKGVRRAGNHSPKRAVRKPKV